MSTVEWDTGDTWGRLVKESVDTPGYAFLIEHGLPLPVNPHKLYKLEGKSPYSTTYNGQSTQRDAAGYVTLLMAASVGYLDNHNGDRVSVPKIADVENEVHIRLLSKVRNAEIDLGVSLGEYRETAAFVRNAMVRTARAYRYARKGKLSKALSSLTGRKNPGIKDIFGSAADLWLTISYAFKPLARDVYDSVRILDKGLNQPPLAQYVRTSKKFVVASEIWDPQQTYVQTVQGLLKCSGKWEVVIDSPFLYTFEQVGLVNPINLAWELTPFSFVVDWFVPVNSYLQNVMPPQGVSLVQGYTYTKLTGGSRNATSLAPVEPDEHGWYTSATTVEKFKNRKVLTTFPTPYLHVPDLDLSKSQVASGMALLWSVLAEGQRSGSRYRRI